MSVVSQKSEKRKNWPSESKKIAPRFFSQIDSTDRTLGSKKVALATGSIGHHTNHAMGSYAYA